MIRPVRQALLVLAILWTAAALAEPVSFPELNDALPDSETGPMPILSVSSCQVSAIAMRPQPARA